MNFARRIPQKEIMDENDVGLDQLRAVFKDINRSSRMLGGNSITINAVLSFIRKYPSDTLSLLDIGCGDGFMLCKLAEVLQEQGINAELYGLDTSQEAIAIARQNSDEYTEIQYFCVDILTPELNIPQCDLVTSSLTMHHFSNQEIPHFLEKCQDLAKGAIIINDLQRSRLAYYLFKMFSAIFIKSSIAKQDGLISIRKGFRKYELESLSQALSGFYHHIQWKWAFRYVWVMERTRLKHV